VHEKAKAAVDILTEAGRVIRWDEAMKPETLVDAIDELIPPDLQVSPRAPDLRVRHVRKLGTDYYLLFNEGEDDLNVRLRLAAQGKRTLLDPITGHPPTAASSDTVSLDRHAMRVLTVRQG
jgi:hypothetical protein